jgi:hypothetical protein
VIKRPRFKSSHSTRRIKLRASCSSRQDEAVSNEDRDGHYQIPGKKSKKERRRIRRRFEGTGDE